MQKIFLVTLFIAVLLCSDVFSFTGGSGIATDPYQISTPNDLEDVNSYPASSFILLNDIDLSDKTYAMAVISPEVVDVSGYYIFDGIPFTGVFDGAGFTIAGLVVDDNDLGNNYLGLFGCIGNGGWIKNINLTNINVTEGGRYIGGLCGKNYGTIINCFSSGQVLGYRVTGGICGQNRGNIINCHSLCQVSGSYSTGGICGENSEALIDGCSSKGLITNGDHNFSTYMGGICGYNYGNANITNCHFVGNIEVDKGVEVIGGICGYNLRSDITNCSSNGNIDGGIYRGVCVGGVCGLNENSSRIINCYATGTIKGDIYVGGLCGLNSNRNTIIQNSYSNTEVLASFACVGGFCGGNSDFASIVNCYSMGQVIGGCNVGGLCGIAYDRASITGCYSVAEIMLPGPYYGGICGEVELRCEIKNCYSLKTSCKYPFEKFNLIHNLESPAAVMLVVTPDTRIFFACIVIVCRIHCRWRADIVHEADVKQRGRLRTGSEIEPVEI